VLAQLAGEDRRIAHSVKRNLQIDADEYDVDIRRFIPHYDDMLATGLELLAALAPRRELSGGRPRAVGLAPAASASIGACSSHFDAVVRAGG
jgi:hypothetical protein